MDVDVGHSFFEGGGVRRCVRFPLLDLLYLLSYLIQNLYATVLVQLPPKPFHLFFSDFDPLIMHQHEKVHQGFAGGCHISIFHGG